MNRVLFLIIIIGFVCQLSEGQIDDRITLSFRDNMKKNGVDITRLNPDSLAEALKWSKQNNYLNNCIYWLEAEQKQKPDELYLKLGLADAYYLNNNWDKLIHFISDDYWEHQEFLRWMHLAFINRFRGHSDWREQWDLAKEFASGSSRKSRVLIDYLAKWKIWDQELESYMWELVQKDSDIKKTCINGLIKLYGLQSNIEGLIRVNLHLLTIAPDNEELISNQLILSAYMSGEQKLNEDLLEKYIQLETEDENRKKLTLAFIYASLDDVEAAKQYFRGIAESYAKKKSNAGYSAYIANKINHPDNEVFRRLAMEGDYYPFEKKFLLGI